MQRRYIITVTLPDWTENQYYLGCMSEPTVVELARRMRRADKGIRAIVRSLDAETELEFWYRVGLRGFNIAPPKNFANSYEIGKRTGQMRRR